jgi:hypothetical protein
MSVGKMRYSAEDINNLGVGGCLLPIKADLKPGTPCDIRIRLSGTSGGLSVRVSGKIARCHPETVAVQFTHIDPDSLFHLQNIVLYNSPDPDTAEQEIAEHPTLV